MGYCDCCSSYSVFLQTGYWDEFKRCIRCKSNLRYRLIAKYLKSIPGLENLTVVDLDPYSPLERILSKCNKYMKTYYSPNDPLGSVNHLGIRCEDITKLTFEDNSIDIIISSDVLEHVDDFEAAMRETERVLRPGGFHLFTVPMSAGARNGIAVISNKTVKRAKVLNDGTIEHYLPPQYHSDPLNPDGILAFWSFGLDLPKLFSRDNLEISIALGPEGKDQRIVWKATKK